MEIVSTLDKVRYILFFPPELLLTTIRFTG